MERKDVTAREAAKDFVDNVWPHLFKGNRNGSYPPYSRVRAFVTAYKAGKETDLWTTKILREYAPERYDFNLTVTIKQP